MQLQVNWASNASNPMGAILYNTYNESDFSYMSSLYNYYGGAGYDKPNSTKNANPESKLWKTKLNRMWRLDQGMDFKYIILTSTRRMTSITPPFFW